VRAGGKENPKARSHFSAPRGPPAHCRPTAGPGELAKTDEGVYISVKFLIGLMKSGPAPDPLFFIGPVGRMMNDALETGRSRQRFCEPLRRMIPLVGTGGEGSGDDGT
jgi:hypothetical protein